jgi:hypothetical protein
MLRIVGDVSRRHHANRSIRHPGIVIGLTALMFGIANGAVARLAAVGCKTVHLRQQPVERFRYAPSANRPHEHAWTDSGLGKRLDVIVAVRRDLLLEQNLEDGRRFLDCLSLFFLRAMDLSSRMKVRCRV